MSIASPARLGLAVATLIALISQVGCNDEKKTQNVTDSGVSKSQSQELDPKLGAALVASSASASPAPKDGAPPASGIFGPGQADKVQKSGAPLVIQMGTEGAEPRVSLASSSAPDWKTPATLTVAIQTGPQTTTPTTGLTFGFSTESAKDKKVEDGGIAGSLKMLAKLQKVSLSATQAGPLPPNLEAELAKMKGSEIQLDLQRGGVNDLTMSLAKSAVPDLEIILAGAGLGFFVFAVPVPDKAVGVGATWIAQGRSDYSGFDVVSYRMYQVKAIDGDSITMSVEMREYSASPVLKVAGIPEGAAMQAFESVGKGELTLRRGESVARKGEYTQQLAATFPGAGQQQDRPLSMQWVSRVSIERGASKP